MDKDYYECQACNNHSEISEVAVPYAFKLLVQELMAVNVLPRIRT
jgi:DNA-directed RNA polymerase II subunit RPB2